MASTQVLAAGLRPQMAAGGKVLGGAWTAVQHSGLPQARSFSAARLSDVPLPVAALLVTMLVPRELEFNIGIALSLQRLVLLAVMPIALALLLSSRAVKLKVFDVLIVSAFAYYWFALFYKNPPGIAFQSGSSAFLEAVGGYVIARVYIRDDVRFLATAKLVFLLALAAGCAAMIESIFHVHWIKDLAVAITGVAPTQVTASRLGLMRAATTFDHPIHYGTFCASVFALAWFLERKASLRARRAAFLGLATFFSLTSAALLGVLLVLAGAVWERVTRGVPRRVWLTIAVSAVLYLLVSLIASRSPERILSTSFVFDADNAYYRLLIWEYGSANVAEHPWIGVSMIHWDRPDWMYSSTVDHYWLATAMGGGLPAVLLYIFGIGLLLNCVYRKPVPQDLECRHGWTAAVVVLLFIGTTVHFWREIEVYFTFVLGMGAWLADPAGPGARVVSMRPFALKCMTRNGVGAEVEGGRA